MIPEINDVLQPLHTEGTRCDGWRTWPIMDIQVLKLCHIKRNVAYLIPGVSVHRLSFDRSVERRLRSAACADILLASAASESIDLRAIICLFVTSVASICLLIAAVKSLVALVSVSIYPLVALDSAISCCTPAAIVLNVVVMFFAVCIVAMSAIVACTWCVKTYTSRVTDSAMSSVFSPTSPASNGRTLPIPFILADSASTSAWLIVGCLVSVFVSGFVSLSVVSDMLLLFAAIR